MSVCVRSLFVFALYAWSLCRSSFFLLLSTPSFVSLRHVMFLFTPKPLKSTNNTLPTLLFSLLFHPYPDALNRTTFFDPCVCIIIIACLNCLKLQDIDQLGLTRPGPLLDCNPDDASALRRRCTCALLSHTGLFLGRLLLYHHAADALAGRPLLSQRTRHHPGTLWSRAHSHAMAGSYSGHD